MKKIFSIFGALLAGAMMFSCTTDSMDDIKFGTEITASVEALDEFAAENAEAQTLEVTADGEWMAVAPAWLEVTPSMGGEGTTVVTVKARDNKEKVAQEDGAIVEEMGPQRSGVLQFAGEQDMKEAVDADGDGEQDVDENGKLVWNVVDALCEVAVSQAGDPNKWDPAKPRPVTMKYFNEEAAPGDGFTYVLTGKITEVANTLYGNFYFEDETGTAYVYGLLTPDGEAKTQWAAAGLKVNDVITVQGARGEYNGSPQMTNAIYVSHESGEASPIVDATIAEFLAAETGGTQYRISGVVTEIAKAEYGNVYIKDATAEVYVYGIGAQGEFEGMGIEVGDIVTLLSNRGEYKGNAQATNSTLEKKIDVTPVATVAEFLATEEDGTYYMLSGTIDALKDGDLYGNFNIADESGSVYVYGLLNGWKGEKKLFQTLLEATGMKAGDKLTLIGKHTSYNGTEQVGSAFYFSHEAGEQGGGEPELTPSAWSIVGSFNNWTVDAGTTMYAVDGYYVAYGFEYAAGVEFKFVENAGWAVNRGGNGSTAALNTAYDAYQDGSNITIAAAGTYDLYLNEALDKYYVMEAGKTPADAEQPVPTESWDLMGDFENNNWATPIALVADGSYYVAQDVVFANANNEGLAFKVRKDANWSTSYGADGSTYELGTEIALNGSANVFVNGVVGEKYDFYFDATNMTIWVMQDGLTPGQTPGGSEPEELETIDAEAQYVFKQVSEFTPGKWYAIVSGGNAATALTSNYGYLQPTAAIELEDGISLPASCAYGFLTTDGGYTIQQYDGKYVYQSGTYNSFNVSADAPTEGSVWSVAANADGTFTITNVEKGKYIQLDSSYGTYGCYDSEKGTMPVLYELVGIDESYVEPTLPENAEELDIPAIFPTDKDTKFVVGETYTMSDNVSFTYDFDNGSTSRVTKGEGLRFYKNDKITFKFAKNVVKIEVQYYGDSKYHLALTPSVGTWTDNYWSGDATNSIQFTPEAGQVRFNKMIVYYAE